MGGIMTDHAVAIVDATDVRSIVWHVGVDPLDKASRFHGAWTYPNDDNPVDNLVLGRVILATDAGHSAAKHAGATTFLDPQGTVDAIRNVIADLQFAFDETAAARRPAALVAPDWPRFADWTSPVAKADPPVQAALGAARWLAGIADGWRKLERERRIRPYLPGGSNARPMPLVTE